MFSHRSMTAAPQRVVSSRLRVIQRDFLTRRGGRTNLIRSSTAVGYSPTYMNAYKGNVDKCPRLVDAEAVHGDEQTFWTARRDFYRSRAAKSFYPIWDRQAQVLVMMTREVVRIPQEAAFRLFTLGLRMLLLPRVVAGTELLLPSWLSMNAEALLSESGATAGGEKKADDTPATAADASGAPLVESASPLPPPSASGDEKKE